MPLVCNPNDRLSSLLRHARRFRSGTASVALLGTVFLIPVSADAQTSEENESVLYLDPIVITANLRPTDPKDVGSAVTVISGEELEKRGVTHVSDILREVPGVAVNRAGPVGGVTQMRLRGSEGNQTLVIIDGIKVNDPSSASEFDFAHLLAEEIERIEILRGPQSALYGSDAIGGVINIITRRGSGKPKLTLKTEAGSHGTGRASATVSGGGETYDFLVGGTGFTTDGISAADQSRGNPEEDGYRNGTGFAKIHLRPSEIFDMSLVGRFTDFATEGDGEIGGVGAVDADNVTSGQQTYLRAQGRLNLMDDRWEHIFGVSHARNDRDFSENNKVTAVYQGETTRLDYQTNFLFDAPAIFDSRNVATFAVQHEQNSAISESAWSSFDRSVAATGFVGQYQTTLFDRLALTGAIRHDANEMFEDATTFRLTGAYSFEESGTKLRASYGTGVKNPTLFELYGFTDTYEGNPNLRPEHARGWDVGVDQRFWDGRVAVEATYFNQSITDLITGSGETSINLPGESSIQGVELGMTFSLAENLSIRGAYTYTDGEDSAGETLIRRPAHVASLNINYRFLDDKANINLGVTYNGEQTDWFFDEQYNRKTVTLAPYTLVNLGASYKLTEISEIYGRIENVFDAEYQEVFTYGSPGRTGYVGLKFSY